MSELPLATIKRISGVKGKKCRVGNDAVDLISKAAEVWIKELATESFVFTEHAGRKTMKAIDVMPVLEKMGIKIPIEKPVKSKKKPL